MPPRRSPIHNYYSDVVVNNRKGHRCSVSGCEHILFANGGNGHLIAHLKTRHATLFQEYDSKVKARARVKRDLAALAAATVSRAMSDHTVTVSVQLTHPPCTDESRDSQQLQTYEQLLKTDGSHSAIAIEELPFLDLMRNYDAAGSATFQLETLYLMDMHLDVWDRLPDGSHVQHFLNTNLFNHGPRLSLLTLMDRDSFAGFDSAFIYCKLRNSYFKMHVEQLYAPFYNYCWQGSTVWYAVMEEDRQAFTRFLISKVAREHNIGQVTAEEEKLFLALLYSKQIFLDPFDLWKAGVPVYRVRQWQNQVVIGSGTVIHWGMCGDTKSVNEAVNYLPVRWLIDGLPQLLQHVQWLRHYIQVGAPIRPR
jgi:hypothetical protein